MEASRLPEAVDFEERSHKIFVCLIFGRMIYSPRFKSDSEAHFSSWLDLNVLWNWRNSTKLKLKQEFMEEELESLLSSLPIPFFLFSACLLKYSELQRSFFHACSCISPKHNVYKIANILLLSQLSRIEDCTTQSVSNTQGKKSWFGSGFMLCTQPNTLRILFYVS